ncbi:MAG: rod shape-determining protein RodA [Deltaproteobacteria bacterium SG8_13]|nr:MAG: rod shape-determining protein RodA [Deltaproteobacteria bacterium SG8_13]
MKQGQDIRSVTYDIRLLFPVLFLVGIGIVMVYSASSALALNRFGSDYYFLKKQASFALLGTMALVICRHFPYRYYRSLTYPLLLAAVASLTAIHISGLGYGAGGSMRWLRIGSLSFQPSEFARFALIVYLAYSMDKKREQLKQFSVGFVPHILVLAAFTGLIFLQPDFGSVVIFTTLTWIMLFVGGVRVRHLLSALILVLPLAYWLMVNAEYRLKRLLSFLDPWQYPSAEGYQVIHSMMAFGTGKLWGTGVGSGYQKLFYLPEPHTDFIFSVIGEELGLVGVAVILCLYGLILWRGMNIARHTQDPFGCFMAMGLTASITLQVCVNMGVALGLLPTKGLALPFLSYGGSSLLMNMAAIGILMNIDRTGTDPAEVQQADYATT